MHLQLTGNQKTHSVLIPYTRVTQLVDCGPNPDFSCVKTGPRAPE